MRSVKIVFVLLAFVAAALAQEKPKNPLVGNWVCEDDGTKVEIRANNTLTIDGTEYAYKVKNAVINVVGEDGAMAIPFQLDGDTLTVDVEGREMVYTRVKGREEHEWRGNRCGTRRRRNAGVSWKVVLHVELDRKQFLHVEPVFCSQCKRHLRIFCRKFERRCIRIDRGTVLRFRPLERDADNADGDLKFAGKDGLPDRAQESPEDAAIR